jgi:hypothetical protein
MLFYWSACIKPEKWVVMYLCVKSIDFASISLCTICINEHQCYKKILKCWRYMKSFTSIYTWYTYLYLDDSYRPFLMSYGRSRNNYINAVIIPVSLC